jgi:hypothetical protein
MALLRRAAGPLVLEVLAPSLLGSGLPRAPGDAPRPAAPRPGDVGGEEAYRLLRLLDRLRQLYGSRIVIHLIEPFSLAWVLRVIRYRPRRFPVFVIGSRATIAGLDEAAITDRIALLLRPTPSR